MGTPWPDGAPCQRGSVIFISAEDDPADTLRPRLDAHHADLTRIHLLSGVRRMNDEGELTDGCFTLADIPALETALQAIPDCKLVVIDPIGSFIGGRTDAHRDNEVREVLTPVARLAERYGPAVVVVAHRRKGMGENADEMTLGSRAFTGIARTVWHVTRDKHDRNRRLLLPGKNNLAADDGNQGLAFKIVGDPIGAIVWEHGPVSMSADEAMRQESLSEDDVGDNADAVEFLKDRLRKGRVLVSDLIDEARDQGIFEKPLKRARRALGIETDRDSFGGPVYWQFQDTPFEVAIETGICTAMGNALSNGQLVRLSNVDGALPGGLCIDIDYIVRDAVGSTFRLATAPAAPPVEITSPGTGIHFLLMPPPDPDLPF
jgi:putative DNA primase/helicase